MKTRLKLLALGLLLAVYGSSQSRPNFVVFIADDVNFDDFGCTGNSDVQTPNIDRLAAGGAIFENFYLTASSCSVSRNSIMSGRYPHNTGAAELHTQPPDWLPALPGQLRQSGYFTAHAGKFHMGNNVRMGFDVVSDQRSEIGSSGAESWVRVTSEAPLDKPFFLWFAALDAHRQWGPNEFSGTHAPEKLTVPAYFADAAATRQDLAQYYDEVYRFDVRIGQVVEVLRERDQLDNTLIIVMADNGRAFPHSKTRVNDRGMKSPFILHWPDRIESGQRSEALISAIDIAPTLLALGEGSIPETMQGRSFEALLDEPDQAFREWVFAEHNWHDYEAHQRMVRNNEWMYIRNARPNNPQLGPADAVGSDTMKDLRSLESQGRLTAMQADIFVTPRPHEELYFLSTDPEQWMNLAGLPAKDHALQLLRAKLDQWIEETGDTSPQNLTRDYFSPHGDYVRTQWHGMRGEMPGAAEDAIHINAPGPF